MAAASPGPATGSGHRIEVRGLRVTGTHGVLPEERSRAQPFELDLDVWLDRPVAGDPTGPSDALDDTVDYAALVELAASVLQGPPVQLLETLADLVAAAVLGRDRRIAAVEVVVRKLRPPVAHQVDHVGVGVLRQRRAGER